jgi:hypothetical protein
LLLRKIFRPTGVGSGQARLITNACASFLPLKYARNSARVTPDLPPIFFQSAVGDAVRIFPTSKLPRNSIAGDET